MRIAPHISFLEVGQFTKLLVFFVSAFFFFSFTTTTNAATTFIGTGVDPVSSTTPPGGVAIFANSFEFKTDTGTDVISAVVLNLPYASSTSLVEITNSAGSTVYGSVSNPAGTTGTTSITLSTNTLTATTASTTYKIRITPKSHSNLPSGILGQLYPIKTIVRSWTGTNVASGVDSATTTITIDNKVSSNFKVATTSLIFSRNAYATYSNAGSVDADDLNNDGYIDLVAVVSAFNKLCIYLNNKNGGFDPEVCSTSASNSYGVITEDFNNDGYTDIAETSFSSSNIISVHFNNKNGTFAAGVNYTVGSYSYAINAADFNNDGYIDIVATNHGTGGVSTGGTTLSVLINNGNGTFATKVDYTTGTDPVSVTSADLNNDGNVDLVVANETSNSVSVFINNGNGTYAAKVDYTTGTLPRSVTAADLDNDGDVDLAVANGTSNSVSVFKNNGGGTFAAKVDYATGVSPISITSADANNDGYIDLAVANFGSSSVSFLSNNGNATFATKVDFQVGVQPRFIATADFDNNGFSDFVVPHWVNAYLSVISNTNIGVTTTPSSGAVALSYTAPPGSDIQDIIFLRSTSTPVIDSLTDGVTYTTEQVIGSSVVLCIYTPVVPSTSRICNLTNLPLNTTYYFKAFVKDKYGNYSDGVSTTPASVISSPFTFIGTGVDPVSSTTPPGGVAIFANSFEFKTDTGTDVISAVVLNLPYASSTSLVEITNSAGSTVYGSVSNPAGTTGTTSITLSTNTLTATNASTTYKIRITPKTQANLPSSVLGRLYPVKASVASWTSSNNKSGTDSANTVTIDNQVLPVFGVSSLSYAAKVDYAGGSNYSVTSADLDNDGDLDLAVSNWISALLYVFRNNGNGTYATKVDYTTGSVSYSVTSADLDNDGDVDLVTANNNSASVSVFKNNGDGTFATKVDYITDLNPKSVTSADLDNDGDVDLVTVNSGSFSVSVLKNNGDGTFATKINYNTNLSASFVTAADLDNDGDVDLAVTSSSGTGLNFVSVFKNNGDGTFATKVDYTTGNNPYSVTAADLDNDGDIDLAVANQSADSVSVLTNNGNGTFATKVDYTTGSQPYSVTAADLDNDGDVDLATANYNSTSVSVLTNNGNGTFATKVDYTTGSSPKSVTAADLDNDGDVDLAVTNQTPTTVSVLKNNGDGVTATAGIAQATLSYVNPTASSSITSIVFLRSTSTPVTNSLVDGTTYTAGQVVGSSAVACVDTTLTPEAADSCIATGLTNGSMYYFKAFMKDIYGNYSWGVSTTPTSVVPNATTILGTGVDPVSTNTAPGGSAVFADSFTFKTDSGTDVISAVVVNTPYASSTALIEVTDNAGTTVYGSAANATTSTTTITLSTNTLTANTSTTTYKIRITPKTQANMPVGVLGMLYPIRMSIASWSSSNNKSGTDISTTTVITIDNQALPTFGFTSTSTVFADYQYVSTNHYMRAGTADFNNDGYEDFIAASAYTGANSVTLFINNKNSTFTSSGSYTTGITPYDPKVADFNNDAYIDFVVPNYGSDTISVFINNRNGTFSTKIDYNTQDSPGDVKIADFNADGSADIVVANNGTSSISVYINNGEGVFSSRADYVTYGSAGSVATADFNNDGKTDIAVASTPTTTILFNNGNGTFSAGVQYYIHSYHNSYAITAIDINNDNSADLVIGLAASTSIARLINNGSGTFTKTFIDLPTGPTFDDFTVADFNNDGYDDLATSDNSNNSAHIYFNTKNSRFDTKYTKQEASGPIDINAIDINNDGFLDILTGNWSSSLLWNINKSTSTLIVPVPAAGQVTFSYINPIASSSITSIVTLRSTSTITDIPVDGTTYTAGNTIGAATVACVDTTLTPGALDSCVASSLVNGTTYYFKVFVKDNNGNYSYGVTPSTDPVMVNYFTTMTTGTDPSSTTTAPGNAAVFADSFTFQTQSGTDVISAVVVNTPYASSTALIEITDNAGTTVYGSVANATTSTTTITLSTNTLTANTSLTTYKIRITPKTQANLPVGALGVLYPIRASIASWTGSYNKTGSDTSSAIVTIDNQALPGFGAASVTFTGAVQYSPSARGVSIGDFSGDGFPDAAIGGLYIVPNNKNGTFGSSVYYSGSSPESSVSADFNRDGFVDVATANNTNGSISIYISRGNGTFASSVDYSGSAGAYAITSNDFNGDGYSDIATSNTTANTISVFINNGNGTFATKVDYATGASADNFESIDSADLNNDGYADIVATQYLTTYVASVFINNGNGTFAAKVDYTVGTSPRGVFLGDLNNDGKPDISTANWSSSDVSVLINNGNGTFATKVDYSIGTNPVNITGGDFNSDGYTDLVSINQSNVTVFTNDKDGTFTRGGTFTVSSPWLGRPSDVNNDGYQDLVISGNGVNWSVLINTSSSSGITIAPGGGQGVISYVNPPASSTISSIITLSSTSPISDIPVDGATYSLGNTIGSATVSCIDTTITPSTADSCIATGLTNGLTHYFKVFVKDTNGNYSTGVSTTPSSIVPNPITTLATGQDPLSITIAPGASATTADAFTFQTDNGTDVISAVVVNLSNASSTSLVEITNSTGSTVYGSVANPTGATTSIILSTNTLTANTSLTTYKIRIAPKTQTDLPFGVLGKLYPIRASVASWTSSNNKTGADVSTTTITIDNQALPSFKTSNVSFATKVDYTAGTAPYNVTSSDFNNDGYFDLAVTNGSANTVSVFINNRDGTYATKVDYNTGATPYGIISSDFNNDGNADLALVNQSSPYSVSVFINNGNGTFAAKVDYTTGTSPRSVTTADINNDGYMDLAAACENSTAVSVFINNGNGTFAAKVDYTTGTGPLFVTSADFNNDDFPDLAVTNYSAASVSVLINNGNGTYATKVDYTTGSNPYSVTSGDFNRDGYADLAVANYTVLSVSVLINNGNGTFATKVDYTTGNQPISVFNSDFNNDGYVDLMLPNRSSNSVSVLRNNGNGTFATKVDYTTTGFPQSGVSTDLNNDGLFDMAVSGNSPNAVSVLLNNSASTFTATAGSSLVTLSYTTPPQSDVSSVVILRSTSTPVTGNLVDDTVYTAGEPVGSAAVACVDTTIATSTADSCIATGLTAGTAYFFKAFVKDIYGNYSVGVSSTPTSATPYASPTIISPTHTSVSTTTATLGANISSNGGRTITARGTCWGLAASPTGNCLVEGGTGTGVFTHARTGFSQSTSYYYRGYVDYEDGAPTNVNILPNGQTGDTTGAALSEITSLNATANPDTNGSETASDGAYTVIKGAVMSLSSFDASSIPSNVPITAVTLNVVYGAQDGYAPTTAYVRYNNGGGFTNTTINPTDITGWSSTLTYNLLAQGVDTISELSNLDIEFTSSDTGGGDAVNFDYVYVTVTYTPVSTEYSVDGTFTTATFGPPVLGSTTVTAIGVDHATMGGSISSDGGATITARGTCWGVSPSPATNCVAEGGTSTGAFSHIRTGLATSTLYYVRAYATNANGTAYSSDVSFTTQSALTISSVSTTYGESLQLLTSGGSSTGTLSFTAADGTATGCTITGTSTLTSTSAGTCAVRVYMAADATYATNTSATTTVTIVKAEQAALTLTSVSGTSPLQLTTSGGSGTGTLSFTAANGTAAGCTITGTSTLTSSSVGTCFVRATKAFDTNYSATSSATTTVTISNDIVISTNTTWGSGTYTYDNITITNNATLTLLSSTTGSGLTATGTGVIINAQNITIDAGSTISANGQGFNGGVGATYSSGPGGALGNTGFYRVSGGGYGGNGGNGEPGSAAGGSTYGSNTQPIDLGSGGAHGNSTNGNKGGGAIKLVVSDTFTNNGTVTANGNGGGGSYPGGGSGGSIWVDANIIAGAGALTANGGDQGTGSNGGGGGGGRIALYYVTKTYTGTTTTYGGTGYNGGVNNVGGTGTIYENNLTIGIDSLTVNGGGNTRIIPEAATTIDFLTISGGNITSFSTSTLTFGTTSITGGSVTLLASTTGNAFSVTGTSTVNFPASGHSFTDIKLSTSSTFILLSSTIGTGLTATGYGVTINAQNITVDAGSSISADGKGFAGGVGATYSSGPGGTMGNTGFYRVSGGGYGGNGGQGEPGSPAPGVAYGSVTQPIDLGSGGGHGNSTNGNIGGGAIKLVVSGVFTNNGATTANGNGGGGTYPGGGSGGSIWIDAGTIAGSGAITANGGSQGTGSNGGGGGGGRIALYYVTKTYTGTTTTYGGTGYNGGVNNVGKVGTIYENGQNDFDISGSLYSDEGITPITSSKTIGIAVGTSTVSVQSVTTDTTGAWNAIFPQGHTVSSSTPIVVWVDGTATTRAALVTKAVGIADIFGLNLYQNRVIISHEGAGTSTTNSDLSFYDGDDDSDIQYTSNAGVLSVRTNQELHVAAGKTFAPGGAITINGNASSTSLTDGSFHLPASSTYTQAGTTTIGGSLSASSTAIFTPGNYPLVFNATTTGKSIDTSFVTLGTTTFSGNGGVVTFATTSTTSNLTINSGATVVSPASNLTITGNYTNNGTFLNNTGTVWTGRASASSDEWRSVTYGEGLFVAVSSSGSSNRVMTSPDGIIWTTRDNGVNQNWRSVTYGNGLFVAVADSGTTDRVITSPDGITWTGRTSSSNAGWNSVTYGNGLFVAVAYSGTGTDVMTSPDGITWTGRTSPGAAWESVTYGNGLFVATSWYATSNSNIMVSSDGINWSTSTMVADNQWISVTYGNGLFVAVANTGGGNRVMTSPDGITWTIRTSAADISWSSVTYGNGLFVAVAQSGANNRVMTSPDGITWTARTGIADNLWQAVTYGNGLFVAVSSDGTSRVMTSGSLVTLNSASSQTLTGTMTGTSTWGALSLQGSGTKTFGSNASTSNLTINTGATMVAPAELSITGNYTNNGTSTQYGGTTWTSRNSAADNTWSSVTYGNGLFVAVSDQYSGTINNRVMTSPDGINWTSRTAAANNSWNSATYGNGLFVAVSYNGTDRVMTSPDGFTWTLRTGTANNNWTSVTYGNGLFVAVAQNESGNDIMTSPDGSTWILRNTPMGNGGNWNSITYGNGLFVAVGDTGAQRIMTSSDGINWTYSSGGSSDEWASIVYGNGKFVAVGFGDGSILSSVDGSAWATSTNTACEWTEYNGSLLSYGNGQFVGLCETTGSKVVFTSPDGLTWTPRTPATNNSWNAITYGNGLFVAVARTGTGNRVMTSAIGTTTFSSTNAQVISGGMIGASTLGHVVLSGAGTKNFESNASTSNFSINANATVVAPTSLSISGNYTNSSTSIFSATTSTLVTFSGTTQQTASGTMTGTSAFNNLMIANTWSGRGTSTATGTPPVVFASPASTTATFTMLPGTGALMSSATSTFTNINLGGVANGYVWLRSTASGTPWNLVVPGTQEQVTYVNVKDSHACSGNPNISAVDGTSVDAGGNTCWDFIALNPVLSSESNQVFAYGNPATPISPITITDAVSPAITTANNIRITIATSTVPMYWDVTDTTATITGTAAGKVNTTVSYEKNGAVLVLDVTNNFVANEAIMVSDLSFTTFGALTSATTALAIYTGGANDIVADDQDDKTVVITGSLAFGQHTSGQASNAFTNTTETDVPLYTFRLTAQGEDATINPLVIPLTGIQGITQSDLTNATLYRDVNNNGSHDGGDVQAGGTGAIAINGQSGTVTFSTAITVASTTPSDYVFVADIANLKITDSLNLALDGTNLTTVGVTLGLGISETGSVTRKQHMRGGGGAGSNGGAIGGNAPTGQGQTGGGSQGGGSIDPNTGTSIGNEPDFFAPSSTGAPFTAWTNGSNAYSSDGVYTTTSTNSAQQSYGNFGFNVPGTNAITGIAVKLEANDSSAAGTISVRLSSNGNTAYKTTATLSATDGVYTLGHPSDLWGRSWIPSDFANGTFTIEVLANTTGNPLQIDAIQVNVYHQATGGGQGGGGAVWKESDQHYASVISAFSSNQSLAAIHKAVTNVGNFWVGMVEGVREMFGL